jgi:hypothetical protein
VLKRLLIIDDEITLYRGKVNYCEGAVGLSYGVYQIYKLIVLVMMSEFCVNWVRLNKGYKSLHL